MFRYREEHPGLFPKITEVHKAVGGSYNILKGIFSKFQETFLQRSADPMPQGQQEAFTKPHLSEELNESMNEISSTSEQMKQCAEVFNETTSISSSTEIDGLTKNSLAPPVDEKPPNLHLDSLKIDVVMADRKHIDSELSTKERDFKQRKHLSGSETRCTSTVDAQQSEDLRGVPNTRYLCNVIKGLQNGPKSTVETTSVDSKESTVVLGTDTGERPVSVKEELLERRDLNGINGGSVLEKDNKMFNLFDVFKQIKSKPENGVDGTAKTNDASVHNTMIREENGARNGDDYNRIRDIFSQIITKTEKQTGTNTGSWAHTLPNKKSPGSSYIKALNILSDKTKYVGGITDVLSQEGRNEKLTEKNDTDSDIAAIEYLDSQPAIVGPTPIPKDRSKYGLFVSFLDKTTTVSDVYYAFDGCGPLHEVHFTPSRKLDRYKCANVFFKVGP